jgi:SSS family solute:Na+ symporter
LKILPLFLLVLPGLSAKAIFGEAATGDNAFPMLVTRLMPAGLKGLMVAALMAALMSGMSSALNSCSTLVTIDIYKKRHPNKSEAQLVWFGRITTAVVVALSVLWIPIIPYMSGQVYQYMQSVQAYVAAPITAVFLMGILWRGATARAAFLALALGGGAGAFRFVLDVVRNAGGLSLGPLEPLATVNFLYFSIGVFLACLLLIALLSRSRPEAGADTTVLLTRQWDGSKAEVVWSVVVVAAVVYTWAYFA